LSFAKWTKWTRVCERVNFVFVSKEDG